MRIAVIATSYPANAEDPSGHFVQAEARATAAQGHAVTLFVPRAPGRPVEPGLSLVQLPHLGLFGWPGAVARLREMPQAMLGIVPFVLRAQAELRAKGPFDAIVAHWLIPGFWPIACGPSFERDHRIGSISRNNAVKTTVVAHGSDVRLLERLPVMIKRRILVALAQPHVSVRCVSGELSSKLRSLSAECGLSLERVEVSPCAIEVPKLPEKADMRHKLGISTDPLVLVVCRVVQTKQVDCAIESCFVALGVYPTVIGDGPQLAELSRKYPQARWLGRLPRNLTLQWLRAADCLVSASEIEGAPTVVREARALGTPVVAVNAGDLTLWATEDAGLTVVPAVSAQTTGTLSTSIARKQLVAALAREICATVRC